MLEKITDNLNHNLARVESLVATYESHPDTQGQGRKGVEVLDILRAAVVLLHATLEDVLRNIAYWKLPLAGSDVLNTIPLVGHGPSPKKFLLGDLSEFRGSTVANVFTASVNAFLEQSNFNNTDEIAGILIAVGVGPETVNGTFATLQTMMERRHQIVHRADRQQAVAGSGDHEVRGINKQTVREWAASVRQFTTDLFAKL